MLDSDVIAARPDVLSAALGAAESDSAALVGEPQWDRWTQVERCGLYSLLLDPSRVWRHGIGPFADGGDPAFDLLSAAARSGLRMAAFPFTAEGHVIHRGRGSLAAGARRDPGRRADLAGGHLTKGERLVIVATALTSGDSCRPAFLPEGQCGRGGPRHGIARLVRASCALTGQPVPARGTVIESGLASPTISPGPGPRPRPGGPPTCLAPSPPRPGASP